MPKMQTTQEIRSRGLGFEGSPNKKLARPITTKQAGHDGASL
jgi:hypothetical protein